MSEDYVGQLTRVFQNSAAIILDQYLLVGNMEQTIPMLQESTELSYKTVAKEVLHLVSLGLMEESRRIGNAQTYRFKVDNHMSALIKCAHQMQLDELD